MTDRPGSELSTAPSTRVLIVDDHKPIRDALADAIRADDRLQLAGLASGPDEAIQCGMEAQPDVALVDVRMPAGGGARVARALSAGCPHTRIVAFSAHRDRESVVEMLEAGACGFVAKNQDTNAILDSIVEAAGGGGPIDPFVTQGVVDELRSLLATSEALNEELTALAEGRRQLIQIMNHELMTPITTILGFAQSLARWRELVSPEEIDELSRGVANASGRLERLMRNVAAAALINAEDASTRLEPVRVDAILARAIDEVRSSRNRVLVHPSPARADFIHADADLAVRAVAEVLENCLALSRGEEDVELLVVGSTDEIEIQLLDRGPGIPEAMKDWILRPFTQLDSSNTRDHEGLGLGLYTTSRILDALHGSLRIDRREGGGTVFSLAFPTGERL